MQNHDNLKLKSNIWKFFVFHLFQRRSFMPILSIFFLTLPDTNAKQIGFYSGIGYLTSFLLEIPSGYFGDNFGHKKTLILSKLFMILSTISFVFANGFWLFVSGSVLMAVSLAFSSGTSEVFLHETLVKLKREKQYSKIMSKIAANVSLVSLFLIISLPFFTQIDIRMPLKITLILDVISFFAVMSFINPNIKEKIIENKKSIFELIKIARKTNFYPLAIFTGAILGFALAHSPFRIIYLEGLGLPIVFAGSVMSLSRLVWFLIGHKVHLIEENISLRKHLFFEIFVFAGYYFLIAYFSNIYLIIGLMALVNGYMWGRNQIIKHYLLKRVPNKAYKATYLSIQNQISSLFQLSLSFIIGYFMIQSYKLGFYVLGVGLLIILVLSYYFIKD